MRPIADHNGISQLQSFFSFSNYIKHLLRTEKFMDLKQSIFPLPVIKLSGVEDNLFIFRQTKLLARLSAGSIYAKHVYVSRILLTNQLLARHAEFFVQKIALKFIGRNHSRKFREK